jgi:hypothetical protein
MPKSSMSDRAIRKIFLQQEDFIEASCEKEFSND